MIRREIQIITFLVLSLFGYASFAQNTHFIKEGIIEYERSINMYAILGRMIKNNQNAYAKDQYQLYKNTQPQFIKLQSTLLFSKGKTLFKPLNSQSPKVFIYKDSPQFIQINTIYTDLTKNHKVTMKNFYDDYYLFEDSLHKINWKITGETRDIAGYECQRANAIIMDSVYVVAFYTDQIPVSGGPESFFGLPGMILGIALPHENVTWFATNVTNKAINIKDLEEPRHGKKLNFKQFLNQISSSLKSYGNYANEILKFFIL